MILACSSLKKSFQGIDLLKDITFKIEEHDKLAIIGVNGAGKQHFLKFFVKKNLMIVVIFLSPKNQRLAIYLNIIQLILN